MKRLSSVVMKTKIYDTETLTKRGLVRSQSVHPCISPQNNTTIAYLLATQVCQLKLQLVLFCTREKYK